VNAKASAVAVGKTTVETWCVLRASRMVSRMHSNMALTSREMLRRAWMHLRGARLYSVMASRTAHRHSPRLVRGSPMQTPGASDVACVQCTLGRIQGLEPICAIGDERLEATSRDRLLSSAATCVDTTAPIPCDLRDFSNVDMVKTICSNFIKRCLQ